MVNWETVIKIDLWKKGLMKLFNLAEKLELLKLGKEGFHKFVKSVWKTLLNKKTK